MRPRKVVCGLVGVIMLSVGLAMFAAPAQAASTLYVGPGGGSGHCSAPAYATISGGVAAAQAGDTVVVCPGTYDEVVDIVAPITLRGMAGAVIRPDGTTGLLDQGRRRVAVYVDATASGTTVQGFTIDGTGGPVHYGVYVFNAANVVVKGNTIHDMTNEIAYPVSDVAGAGILYFGWGQGITGADIERNTVYNTGRHGIFVGGMDSFTYDWLLSDGAVIDGNTVYNTWQGPTNDFGAGIQINGARNAVIEDNVVHHTGQPTTGTFYPGVYLAGTVGGSVTGNNIHHNLYGLVVWVNAPFVEFGSDIPSEPTLDHNRIHQNTIQDIWIFFS